MKFKFIPRDMPWSFKITAVAGLILLAEGLAFADLLPGAAMPETVSKALKKQEPTPTEALPPAISTPEPAASAFGPEAQKIKFKLHGIILEGNYVYSNAELELLYKDKLGKTISVADLFNIAQSITNYYRNNGYIISRAVLPPQHIKNGVVRIQIIEGYIGNVDVSGTPHGAKCQVLAFGNKIKECPPLQVSRMEKYLLLANEIPGTQVKAVLSPSKTKTGAADLTLYTHNRPVTGYFSYDNYGTRYIGPQQMTGNLGFNSFATSGDSAQFTVIKTPKGGELTYMDVNYNMPVTDEGTRWLFGGTRVQTHPLFVLQPSQIDGLNTNFYTSVQVPMVRTRTKSLTLQGGFNYNDSYVTSLDAQLYTDHLRSLDFGAIYNFADSWYGVNLIKGDIRQGLPAFGYTQNTNPDTALTSRPGGHGFYTKVDLQASRLQAIKGPLSLFGLLKGQWAANPLLAAEQFTFGGSQIGRGYDVAEIIGDKGAAASVELRYDLGIGRLLQLQSLQLYLFYDAGVIWNRKHIGGVPTKQSAISTGAGTRFYFTKYISGNVMWAQPITKQVAIEKATNQVTVNGATVNRGNGAAPRVIFSIIASFA